MEGLNHWLRLVKSELEPGLIFGTGSRTGTEMCFLEEVYIIVGRVPGLEGYNSGPFVLWKSNLIFGTDFRRNVSLWRCKWGASQVQFFSFQWEKKKIGPSLKKMKLWRLPKIEGSILKYRVPPLWPTYLSMKQGNLCCFILSGWDLPNHYALCHALGILRESSRWMHWLGLRLFEATVTRLFDYWTIFSMKTK